jgi:hypothetical protein
LVGAPLRRRLDRGLVHRTGPSSHRRARTAGGRLLVRRDPLARPQGQSHLRPSTRLIAYLPSGVPIAIEVELAQKSAGRLNAILTLYAFWTASAPLPVIYVCGDQDGHDRVRAAGERLGLLAQKRVRIELLDTIKAQAIAACESNRAERRVVANMGETRVVAGARTHGP